MATKEERWKQNFEYLKEFLTSFAEQGRLGWQGRSADLELNLDPNHLKHFQPDQIFGASFEPHLEGILERLADNAADHAFVEGRELEIAISSRRQGHATIIEVSDNGPGISHLDDKIVDATKITRHSGSDLSKAVQATHVLWSPQNKSPVFSCII